ncbi:copper amine oxidase N-terminal domain-containing protein [Paenibacillus sp. FSL M7-0420]|uniref:copper amine oxidase N-terminal domain-containing protein n=1 Tax=Paenibacillus sp. FSL M7-0420 TaxID=2921609 RepID=UPI0030F592AA
MKSKTIRKTGMVFLASIFVLSVLGTTVFAKQTAQILVNGAKVLSDVEPQLVNGRVMVPLSFISKALGANVNWDNKTKTASIQSQGAGAAQSDVWSQDLSKIDQVSYINARNAVISFIMKHDARDQTGRELVADKYDSDVPTYTPDVIIPSGGNPTTIDFKVKDAKFEKETWTIRIALYESVAGDAELGIQELNVDFQVDNGSYKIKGAWLAGQPKTLDNHTVFPGLNLKR